MQTRYDKSICLNYSINKEHHTYLREIKDVVDRKCKEEPKRIEQFTSLNNNKSMQIMVVQIYEMHFVTFIVFGMGVIYEAVD